MTVRNAFREAGKRFTKHIPQGAVAAIIMKTPDLLEGGADVIQKKNRRVAGAMRSTAAFLRKHPEFLEAVATVVDRSVTRARTSGARPTANYTAYSY